MKAPTASPTPSYTFPSDKLEKDEFFKRKQKYSKEIYSACLMKEFRCLLQKFSGQLKKIKPHKKLSLSFEELKKDVHKIKHNSIIEDCQKEMIDFPVISSILLQEEDSGWSTCHR